MAWPPRGRLISTTPATEPAALAQWRGRFAVGHGRRSRTRHTRFPSTKESGPSVAGGWGSLRCQNWPLAASLNNLVYECEHICRHSETECLGGLEIDGQF